MFLKSALQKAQTIARGRRLSFAQATPQKPEIAKIDILATAKRGARHCVGPGYSHGHFSGQGFQRGVQLKLSSV